MIESLFDGHFPRLWGRRLPRHKYQRPEVKATGKRERLWRGEWREYFIGADGKQHSRHKSQTWSRANHTKAEAQAKLDAIIRGLNAALPKPDGAMTLAAFWNEIYLPIRKRRWEPNTLRSVEYVWRVYIEPAFGAAKMCDLTKAAIEIHLGKLADSGKSSSLVQAVLVRIHSILDEAVDNDFIPKNPARKIKPELKAGKETRSLSEAEVKLLWDATEGMDYVLWRVLVMTGIRIGEALALDRTDITPQGLRIDHSAYNGQQRPTKNKKVRSIPLASELRAELEEWLTTHSNPLVFPNRFGRMHHRGGDAIQGLLKRGREQSGIKDLTFRMCRTTLSTMYEGDLRDAQDILGHHSLAFTLQHYRKPIAERQLKALDEMDARLKLVPFRKKA